MEMRHCNDICLLYTNADGLLNKITELKLLLANDSYKFACLTETKFDEDILEAEFHIPNYNYFKEDRTNRDGGGSIIYVHKSLQAKKLSILNGCESLAIKVLVDDIEIVLVCLYRSPSLSEEGNKLLLENIGKLPEEENIIVVGDVNLPHVDWEMGYVKAPENTRDKILLNEMEYLNMFIEKGFKWYLSDGYTRRRMYGNTIQESLLDQVFSNNEALIYSIQNKAPLGKSDHAVLKVTFKFKYDNSYIVSTKKNWSKITKEHVECWSSNVDWEYSYEATTVDNMWDELYTKLNSFQDIVPDEHVKFDKNGNILRKLPWDCSKLVRKRKEKDKAWKVFENTPNMANYHYALFKQDEFESAEFQAKAKHEKKITKNIKKNSKPLFRYLRMKNKINKTVNKVNKEDGSDTVTPQETANEFAKFFQSVFRIDEQGPLPQQCYIDDTTASQDELHNIIHVVEEKVAEFLMKIDYSKARGPDDIHPKLLKFLASDERFVKALSNLFRKCIEEEHIPEIWKLAHVVPIHKKGPLSQKENYRGISLLCIISKIYEKIIREHIVDTVSSKICSEQHGFVKGKSCLSNLLESLHNITEILKEETSVDIIFFDFQKAFDQVSHHKLLIKMKNIGIDQKTINIIADYLTDRKMQVRVGGSLSKALLILSGVIQGSVIGPLLFIIFINDLPDSIKSICKFFADDLKVIVKPSCNGQSSNDLEALESWQNTWKLFFNLSKCKVLHIGKGNPRIEYKLLEKSLDKVSDEKDLGVLLDSNLSFGEHIQNCINKAKSRTAWLFRNVVSREPEVICQLYKSMIRPHLEYCTQAWAPVGRHGNWAKIMKIENVQRWVTRSIRGMESLTYRCRLESLNLTTLFERRLRGDLIEVFKILNGLCDYGEHFFNVSERTGNLLLSNERSVNNVAACEDYFANRIIKYWNRLPNNVKRSNSVNNFKNNLDIFRNNNYGNGNAVNSLLGQYWELSEDIFSRI